MAFLSGDFARVARHPKAVIVSGFYMLVFEQHVAILGDTTVNINPSADHLAQIVEEA